MILEPTLLACDYEGCQFQPSGFLVSCGLSDLWAIIIEGESIESWALRFGHMMLAIAHWSSVLPIVTLKGVGHVPYPHVPPYSWNYGLLAMRFSIVRNVR